MDWPPPFPPVLSAGPVTVRPYRRADAAELFTALDDERAWEHIPRAVPGHAAELELSIAARLADGHRATFTIRRDRQVVGLTSVLFDPADPAGAEIGGTQLDPAVWGSGINPAVKRLLLDLLFGHGAEWVQLRTDERNHRSAAAIRKLGAADLGVHQDHRVRRDGTVRRSRMFRLTAADWLAASRIEVFSRYLDPRFRYVLTQAPALVRTREDALRDGLNCVTLAHLVIRDLFGYLLPASYQSVELVRDRERFEPVADPDQLQAGDLVWLGVDRPLVGLADFVPRYCGDELLNFAEFPVNHVAIGTGLRQNGDHVLLHASTVDGTNALWPLRKFDQYARYSRIHAVQRLRQEFRRRGASPG